MAGFTTGNSSWLPVNPNYNVTNVKKERATAGSHLNVFKRLVQFRKNKKVLQDGDTEIVADENLLIIKRETEKPKAQLFAVLNLGKEAQNFTATNYFTTNKRLLTATIVSSNSGARQG
jgi:glycosidase